jgi:hypothetical protein
MQFYIITASVCAVAAVALIFAGLLLVKKGKSEKKNIDFDQGVAPPLVSETTERARYAADSDAACAADVTMADSDDLVQPAGKQITLSDGRILLPNGTIVEGK